MSVATLSTKHQITLPADLRSAMGLKPGDQVAFVLEGRHAVLRMVPKSDITRFAGTLKPALKGAKLGIKAALASRARKRYAKGKA